jgi:hypothetical protein
MPIVVQERTLHWVLFSAAGIVSLLGLAAELVHQLVPSAHSPVLPMFSLSVEANFPTWYSSLLLAACGISLLIIAAGVRQSAGKFYRRWALLGAVFVYMSLDEAVELHEHLGEILDLHGVLYFSWVVPAGIVVLLLGLWYLPFLKHLPSKARWRFVLAGVIYVGGALFMELPLGWWAERAGRHNVVYGLIDWVEETMEIFGATLFLLSLLGYLREQYGELRLALPEKP